MELRALALSRRNEDRLMEELRWFLGRENHGDLGLRSNFLPMKARLECGGRTGGRPILDPYDEDILAHAFDDRRIRRALEAAFGWRENEARCAEPFIEVLLHEFTPCFDWQEAFLEAGHGEFFAAERLAEAFTVAFLNSRPRVAPLTRAAREAHHRSSTTFSLAAWLVRLVWRSARRQGPTPDADAALIAAIRREADGLLAEAVRRYHHARRSLGHGRW